MHNRLSRLECHIRDISRDDAPALECRSRSVYQRRVQFHVLARVRVAVKGSVDRPRRNGLNLARIGLKHELRHFDRIRIRILIRQRDADRMSRSDLCVRRRRMCRDDGRNRIARLHGDISRRLIDHELFARCPVVKVTAPRNRARHNVEHRARRIGQNVLITGLGVKDRHTPRIVGEQAADRIHILRRKTEDNRILHISEPIGLTVLQNRRGIRLAAVARIPVLAHIVRDAGKRSVGARPDAAEEAVLLDMVLQAHARHRQRVAVIGRNRDIDPVGRILPVVRREHRVGRKPVGVGRKGFACVERSVAVVVHNPARKVIVGALADRDGRHQSLCLDVREGITLGRRTSGAEHFRIELPRRVGLYIRRSTGRCETAVCTGQVAEFHPLTAVAVIVEIQVQLAARHGSRIALRIAAHADSAAPRGRIAKAGLRRAIAIAVNLREGLGERRADRPVRNLLRF